MFVFTTNATNYQVSPYFDNVGRSSLSESSLELGFFSDDNLKRPSSVFESDMANSWFGCFVQVGNTNLNLLLIYRSS